jgi:hypothetical protein
MPARLFILLFLSLPLFGFADEPALDQNSQLLGYVDLKGNGLQEEVVLNGNRYNNLGGYYFKSLKIIDGIHLVYNLDARDGFDEMTVENYEVGPLRKGKKWQILILLRGSGDSGSTLKIIEWDGKKYAETLSEHCWTAEVKDLEKNAEFQMLLAQQNHVPHVYDFAPPLRKYVVSDQNHLSYFKELIKGYELNLAEFPDNASGLVLLGEIVEAAKIVGDTAKEQDAQRRLSEWPVKMEQKQAASTQAPAGGVPK